MTQHYAHITNGIVDFVLRVEPRTVFADPYASEFDACPEGVAVGWLHDGEAYTAPPVPEPLIAAESAPTACTPAQGYVALFALKSITKHMLYEAVEQIPDPVQKYMAQIGLEHTGEWKRDSTTMQAMAQLLSLTEQDLDDLFLYAKNVEV